MIAAATALLIADTTLASTLTGGVHNGLVVGEISRQATTAAFDANKELKPCALIRPSSDTPTGPLLRSARVGLDIYLYARTSDASALDTARQRIYVLLHRVRLTPLVEPGGWEFTHTQDILGQYESALDARLVLCRYRGLVRKG